MHERQASEEVAHAFPDLRVRSVTHLGSGQDSDAFLVNGRWVFRFPRRPEVARALAREIAVLPRLAPVLPVAVPRFTHLAYSRHTGLPFAGYRRIPGVPLTTERFVALPPANQEHVLATLASMLRAIHDFSTEEAAALGVEALDVQAWVASAWAAGKAAVVPRLTAAHARTLERMVRRFLQAQRQATPPCLLYADFAPEHLLIAPRTRTLSGLIDWGDMAIGDPDFDLLYLHQDYGPAFVRRLLEHAGHPAPAHALATARLLDACDHLATLASVLRDRGRREADEDVEAQSLLRGLEALLEHGD